MFEKSLQHSGGDPSFVLLSIPSNCGSSYGIYSTPQKQIQTKRPPGVAGNIAYREIGRAEEERLSPFPAPLPFSLVPPDQVPGDREAGPGEGGQANDQLAGPAGDASVVQLQVHPA